ncbi:hypothetical protein [Glutamicibacter sp. Je.9.36]|uniref:hypothetical protein n=1 Tax=Glutamicibacter sp. Je.9.36 TaxID=3142837 RepID=UPI003DA96E8B
MNLLSNVPAAIVTVRVKDLKNLQATLDSATWFRVQLPALTSISENPPTISATDIEVVPPKEANKLSAILDMDNWPRVPAPRLAAVLDAIPPVDGVVVHDVGQGSANALFDSSGEAVIYFDTGRAGKAGAGMVRGGMVGKTKVPSAPAGLQLCACSSPLVVLSHWDLDHWAAAKDGKRELLESNWVVPSQKIGGTHSTFAALILKSGGSIFVVKRSSSPKTGMALSQNVYIKYGKGKNKSFKDRNDSGLVLTATINSSSGRHTMFFPGDARYDKCETPPREVDLLVASHHGADPGGPLNLPKPKNDNQSRLVYSFGHPNGYKHPTQAALKAHQSQGWNDNNLNHCGQNQSSPAGNVRATYSASRKTWQSIVFPASSLPTAIGHFGKIHKETLSS